SCVLAVVEQSGCRPERPGAALARERAGPSLPPRQVLPRGRRRGGAREAHLEVADEPRLRRIDRARGGARARRGGGARRAALHPAALAEERAQARLARGERGVEALRAALRLGDEVAELAAEPSEGGLLLRRRELALAPAADEEPGERQHGRAVDRG